MSPSPFRLRCISPGRTGAGPRWRRRAAGCGSWIAPCPSLRRETFSSAITGRSGRVFPAIVPAGGRSPGLARRPGGQGAGTRPFRLSGQDRPHRGDGGRGLRPAGDALFLLRPGRFPPCDGALERPGGILPAAGRRGRKRGRARSDLCLRRPRDVGADKIPLAGDGDHHRRASLRGGGDLPHRLLRPLGRDGGPLARLRDDGDRRARAELRPRGPPAGAHQEYFHPLHEPPARRVARERAEPRQPRGGAARAVGVLLRSGELHVPFRAPRARAARRPCSTSTSPR